MYLSAQPLKVIYFEFQRTEHSKTRNIMESRHKHRQVSKGGRLLYCDTDTPLGLTYRPSSQLSAAIKEHEAVNEDLLLTHCWFILSSFVKFILRMEICKL